MNWFNEDTKVLIGFLAAFVLVGVVSRGCQHDVEGVRLKREADLKALCIESGGTVAENSCVRCK